MTKHIVDIITVAIDDDVDLLEQIKELFDRHCIKNYKGYESETDLDKDNVVPLVAIIDHRLDAGILGYEVMDRIREKNREHKMPIGCEFIIISGQHNAKLFSEYTKRGIHDYIEKKTGLEFETQLIDATKSAIEKVRHHISIYEQMVCSIEEIKKTKLT
jgi:FixJ family two-component response regulator